MKAIITFAGILLIVTGCYLVYDGYQVKQTAVAQVEKGISSAIRAITDNSVKTSTNINNESGLRMIGGGVDGITGFLLLAVGLRPRKKRR